MTLDLNQNLHTIAGQPNSMAYTMTKDNYLIYASGSCVVIYKCDYSIEYITTLPAECFGNKDFDIVTSICSVGNRIFVAFGTKIAEIGMNGDLKNTIDVESSIQRICCSTHLIYIGCDAFTVINLNFEVQFTMVMPFPIYILSCSTDGKFIISGGQQDHLIKVWQLKPALLRGKKNLYSFVYLKHPKPVVHIEWKTQQNILLTNCMDMTTRIFQEDGNRLVLSCLIEPNKFENEKNEEFISLHWLSKSVLETMVDTSKVKHLTPTKHQDEMTFMNHNLPNPALIQDETLHYWQQKVQLMINEHPVLIYGVSKSGVFFVWSLQNMQTTPRSIARVLPLIKIPNAFISSELDPDYSYFFSSIYCFHAMPPVVLDEEMSPYKVFLVGQNLSTGHIHIYLLDFIESFLRQSPATIILIAKFQGHVLQPKVNHSGFTRHPDQLYPYLLSFRDQDIILWKVSSYQMRNEPLQEISKLNLDKCNPLNVKWIISDPAFVAVGHYKCYIYKIVENDNKLELQCLFKSYIPNDYSQCQLFISPPLVHIENCDLELFLVGESTMDVVKCNLEDFVFKCDIIATIPLDYQHIHRCFSSPSLLHLKYKANVLNSIPKALFYGIKEDQLKLFQISSNALTELASCSLDFQVDFLASSPKQVALCAFNHVSIYNCHVLDFSIHFSAKFDLNPIQADWMTCTNEEAILAVLTASEIVIIAPLNNGHFIQFTKIPLTQMYQKLSWLHSGGLCLMSKQQLSIIHSDSIVSEDCDGEFSPNILEYMILNTNTTNDHDPEVLYHYALWHQSHLLQLLLKQTQPLTYSQITHPNEDTLYSSSLDISTDEHNEPKALINQLLSLFSEDAFATKYAICQALDSDIGCLGLLGCCSTTIETPTQLDLFIKGECIYFCSLQQLDKLMKADYIANKNIERTMMYYLALNKKPVVLALWKQQIHPDKEKMLQFLQNGTPTAASKNAFALLSKQRIIMAASFFLLGNDVMGCIQILIRYNFHFEAFMVALCSNKVIESSQCAYESVSSSSYWLQALFAYKSNQMGNCLVALSHCSNPTVAYSIYKYIISNNGNKVKPSESIQTTISSHIIQYYQRLKSPALSLIAIKQLQLTDYALIAIQWIPTLLSSFKAYKLNTDIQYKDSLLKSLEQLCLDLQIDASILNELLLWHCILDRSYNIYFDVVGSASSSSSNSKSLIYFCDQVEQYTHQLRQFFTNPSIILQGYVYKNALLLLQTIKDYCHHLIPCHSLLGSTMLLLINACIYCEHYFILSLLIHNLPSLLQLSSQSMFPDLLLLIDKLILLIESPNEEDSFPYTQSGQEAQFILNFFVYRYLMHTLLTVQLECHDVMLYCLELEQNKLVRSPSLNQYKQNLRTTSQGDLWDIVVHWADQQGLVLNLNHTQIQIEPQLTQENVIEELCKFDASIFSSGINCVNRNEMVICTSKGIYELDINYTWCSYKDIPDSKSHGSHQTSHSNSTNVSNHSGVAAVHRNQFEESLSQMSSQAELEHYLPLDMDTDVVQLTRPFVSKELAMNGKYKLYAVHNGQTSSANTNTNSFSTAVYQFGTSKHIIEFNGNNGKIQFDPFGEKLMSIHLDGQLLLFDLMHGTKPVLDLALNYKILNDFCFLASGTLLGCSGKNKMSVVDTLMPIASHEVFSYAMDSNVLKIVEMNDQLIGCGKKGDIIIIDRRMNKILDQFNGHHSQINCVQVIEETLVTGSSEGSLKQFNQNYGLQQQFKKMHGNKFMSESSGISSICHSNLNVYTAGYDGYIKFIRKQRLKQSDFVE